MEIKLENDILEVTINSEGAELSSITGKETAVQYLWDADEKYWKRSAPVLFPFVGSLKRKKYIYDGREYPMGQHGFARDMEFEIESQKNDEAWFLLRSNMETLVKYPFEFELKVGYKLEGSSIKVYWIVKNIDTKELLFSIGGHPAFMCPVSDDIKQSDCYIKFDTEKDLKYGLLNSDGLLLNDVHTLKNENGFCKIDEHMFDKDALIIEGKQASKVSLCTPDKKPYLTVIFDAPLFGLWSPAGKNAPFVCIEPWYGRCDRADFAGTLAEREYGNKLAAGEEYKKEFTITIE